MKVDLSFLRRGTYNALIVRDRIDNDAAVDVETRQVSGAIELPMRSGGGFVVRLTR